MHLTVTHKEDIENKYACLLWLFELSLYGDFTGYYKKWEAQFLDGYMDVTSIICERILWAICRMCEVWKPKNKAGSKKLTNYYCLSCHCGRI